MDAGGNSPELAVQFQVLIFGHEMTGMYDQTLRYKELNFSV